MELNSVREGTRNRSKYTLDATGQRGREVEEGDRELHCADPIEGVTALTMEETPRIWAKEHSGPRGSMGDQTPGAPQAVDHTIRSVSDLVVKGEAGHHMQGGSVELFQEQPTEAEPVVHQSPPLKPMLSSKHYKGTCL